MPLIGFVSIWSALLLLKAGDFKLFRTILIYFSVFHAVRQVRKQSSLVGYGDLLGSALGPAGRTATNVFIAAWLRAIFLAEPL